MGAVSGIIISSEATQYLTIWLDGGVLFPKLILDTEEASLGGGASTAAKMEPHSLFAAPQHRLCSLNMPKQNSCILAVHVSCCDKQ